MEIETTPLLSEKKKRRASKIVAPKKQPVLNDLFNPRKVQAPPRERKVKSFLYTLLNPKSRQLPAVCFKYFIAFVIFFDFVVYIVSTEPHYKEQQDACNFFDMVEGFTSYLFLLEYLARIFTITENRKYRHAIWGRLHYAITAPALIDLFATLPYFCQFATSRDLPQLTYLRTFRLFRILKTNGFVGAADAVRRVLYYNRQIMSLSVFVGLYMVLFTSILMYHLRPREGDSSEFQSILSTMYLATLMLTGQGGPEGNLPWYTKAVVLLTSAFSIG